MFEWLTENTSTLTNIGNGIWICISALVSFYMFKLWKKTTNETVKSMAMGIFLVGISSALHRFWWFVGIITSPDNAKYANWANDYSGVLTFLVLVLAMGYSLHIKVMLQDRNRFWWLRPLGAVLFGASLGYAI